jgi:hypothetical protein
VTPSSSDRPSNGDAQDQAKPVQYPTGYVIGVLETVAQSSCAVDALVHGGFLESEIELGRGEEFADRLGASSGRPGFRDWLIRLFGTVGLKNTEIETKDQYEQALRDGHTVVAVLAPTEERKDLAAQLLRDCGAQFIHFFGSLALERMRP